MKQYKEKRYEYNMSDISKIFENIREYIERYPNDRLLF